MLTLAEIKAQIIRLINKSTTYSGFITDDKQTDAVQDCLDYITMRAFQAGDGWFNKIDYITTAAGSFDFSLPDDVAILNQVRYLQNDTYVPVPFDDFTGEDEVSSTSSITTYPARVRVIERALRFNPPPAEVGTDYIQIDYTAYPARLTGGGSNIDKQFDYGMLQYIKWRAASILMAQVGRAQADWKQYEMEWEDAVMQHIYKRIRTRSFIKEFDA